MITVITTEDFWFLHRICILLYLGILLNQYYCQIIVPKWTYMRITFLCVLKSLICEHCWLSCPRITSPVKKESLFGLITQQTPHPIPSLPLPTTITTRQCTLYNVWGTQTNRGSSSLESSLLTFRSYNLVLTRQVSLENKKEWSLVFFFRWKGFSTHLT